MRFDVSVILTLHNEGRVAYRTLRGLERAVSFAKNRGVAVEIVIVMDRVEDPVLKKITAVYKEKFHPIAIVRSVDFGALSLSRNHGIQQSHGEVIVIHDGDDLFCENWIFETHKICTSDPTRIAHPEATYYFPFEKFVRFANGTPEAIFNLIIYNQWTALTAAHREIFCEYPYVMDVPPYAYQDWLWNCMTASKGFHHVTVPGTVLAIRQKPFGKSLWQNTYSANKAVRPNNHFRNIFLRKYDLMASDVSAEKELPWLKTQWEKAVKYPVDYFYTHYPKVFPLLLGLYRVFMEKFCFDGKDRNLPPWLIAEIGKLAEIDPSIQIPRNVEIRRPDKTSRMRRAVIPEMKTLVETIQAKVFIVDTIKPGHITRKALPFIAAQDKNFLITTEKVDPSIQKWIPSNAILVPIGNSRLFFEERLQLLYRLLLETDTEWIHIIHSRIAYKMFYDYVDTFSDKIIYTTLLDPAPGKHGFGWELTEYADFLDAFQHISTDTFAYKEKIQTVYGIPPSKISRVSTPPGSHVFSATDRC